MIKVFAETAGQVAGRPQGEQVSRIFEFQDYRDFLKERLDEFKARDKKYSYQYFASRLNMTRAQLHHIAMKRRHLGMESVSELCSLLGFTQFETQYFTFMLLAKVTEGTSINAYFTQVLASLHGRYSAAKFETPPEPADKRLGMFGNWLDMTVEALVRIGRGKATFEWLMEKLSKEPVTREQLSHSITRLKEMEIIAEGPNGFESLKAPGFLDLSGPDVDVTKVYQVGLEKGLEKTQSSNLYGSYQFHMIALALERPEAWDVVHRLAALQKELIELGEKSKNPSNVYFISSNFFQVTHGYES